MATLFCRRRTGNCDYAYIVKKVRDSTRLRQPATSLTFFDESADKENQNTECQETHLSTHRFGFTVIEGIDTTQVESCT